MKLSLAEFEPLALEQMDMLYRVARRLTHDTTRAEDLVQETYLRAFGAHESFDLQTFGIRPWLLRILHNLHLNLAQREGRQPLAVEEPHFEAAGSDQTAPIPIDPRSFENMDQRLVQAIDALPSEYSAVLLMWAVDDLSYKEIADALEIPIGTVMSRLHRARSRLSDQLRAFATEERIIRD